MWKIDKGKTSIDVVESPLRVLYRPRNYDSGVSRSKVRPSRNPLRNFAPLHYDSFALSRSSSARRKTIAPVEKQKFLLLDFRAAPRRAFGGRPLTEPPAVLPRSNRHKGVPPLHPEENAKVEVGSLLYARNVREGVEFRAARSQRSRRVFSGRATRYRYKEGQAPLHSPSPLGVALFPAGKSLAVRRATSLLTSSPRCARAETFALRAKKEN